jgi:hypothetical protein
LLSRHGKEHTVSVNVKELAMFTKADVTKTLYGRTEVKMEKEEPGKLITEPLSLVAGVTLFQTAKSCA